MVEELGECNSHYHEASIRHDNVVLIFVRTPPLRYVPDPRLDILCCDGSLWRGDTCLGKLDSALAVSASCGGGERL